MNKYFYTKKSVYKITHRADGCIEFYPSTPNAGQLILQNGGMSAFLAKCVDDERDYHDVAASFYKAIDDERKAKEKRKAEREDMLRTQYLNDYAALTERYDTIPATIENLRIVMHYLNSMNWGLWRLPKMDRAYSAHQYKHGDGTITTLTLAEGFSLHGETWRNFKCGCAENVMPQYLGIDRI